jgi:hypothetical protein
VSSEVALIPWLPPSRPVSPPPVLHIEEEAYNFSHARRGTCVVINNRDFDARTTGQTARDGTDIDADAVTATFAKLGFDVVRYDNLNTIDMTVNLAESEWGWGWGLR